MYIHARYTKVTAAKSQVNWQNLFRICMINLDSMKQEQGRMQLQQAVTSSAHRTR